jgi:hypothetical protein
VVCVCFSFCVDHTWCGSYSSQSISYYFYFTGRATEARILLSAGKMTVRPIASLSLPFAPWRPLSAFCTRDSVAQSCLERFFAFKVMHKSFLVTPL